MTDDRDTVVSGSHAPPDQAIAPILAEIDRRLVREEPILEIFRHVADRMVEQIGLPLVWIGLRAPDGSVESQVAAGPELAYLEGAEIRWDESPEGFGPTGTCMRSGEPVAAVFASDPSVGPWRERAARHGLASSLAVPLRTNDHTVGAINLYSRRPDAFSDREYPGLRRIADQLSVAVLRARDIAGNRLHARALDALGEGVAVLDLAGRIAWANAAFATMVGRSGAALADEPLSAVLDDAEGGRELAEARAGADRWEGELSVERPAGGKRLLHTTLTPVRDTDGEPTHHVVVAQDVTERRRAREALRRSERRYRTLFERAQEAISITDPDGRFVDVNPAWLELLGHDRQELEGSTLDECCMDQDEYRRFRAAIETDGFVNRMEMRLRHRDGEELHCLVSATAQPEVDGDDGGTRRYVSFVQDISERKQFEEQLRYQALHDPLTELPNRALFRDRLEQARARADRHDSVLALAFVDLDRFKAINDSYGHSAGDRVLRKVAGQLSRSVRSQDTVARIGGDEFVVLVEDLAGRDAARAAADRIVRELKACDECTGAPYHLTASVGVVAYDGGDQEGDAETLLRRADLAMYRAKERKGTTRHLFDPEEDSVEFSRLEREQELRAALHDGQISPAYQPVVELETGAVWGVELLARWERPGDGSPVPPTEFVSLAEETGLIQEMGRQLLAAGTEDLAGWRANGSAPRLLFNLSASQFDDPELPALIEERLERNGLSPSRFFLEVTETELMQSPQRIEPIRELGVRLVVDDFGTGYSSLGYLRDLQVDGLKVDMSFVHGMIEEEEDRAIVETILTLGQRLGLLVIAEGIETSRQEQLLRRLGCELGQGYRFARPGPAGKTGRLLADGPVAGTESDVS